MRTRLLGALNGDAGVRRALKETIYAAIHIRTSDGSAQKRLEHSIICVSRQNEYTRRAHRPGPFHRPIRHRQSEAP